MFGWSMSIVVRGGKCLVGPCLLLLEAGNVWWVHVYCCKRREMFGGSMSIVVRDGKCLVGPCVLL